MIQVFSPAKINLFFKLIGLRKDRFHNLESFFQAIDLGDLLTISKSDRDEFKCSKPFLKFDQKNLIYTTLQLFREKTKKFDAVSIELEKNIPIGGGLGGGSSNVASTLWCLNQLFDTQVTDVVLQQWAGEISSDAPFFFSRGSALCSGTGNIIEEKKCPHIKTGCWLVAPPYQSLTSEVYLYSKKVSKIKESADILTHSLYTDTPIHRNDLEEAAFLLNPRLALLKDELECQNGESVFMTGSGSSFVYLGINQPKIKSPVQIFPIQYINRDPSNWYFKDNYATI